MVIAYAEGGNFFSVNDITEAFFHRLIFRDDHLDEP